MKILVVAAGAVGQGVGSFLASSGHDVTMLLRERFRKPLSEKGIRVYGVLGTCYISPAQVCFISDCAELVPGDYDIILLCAKSYDTEAAIPIIEQVLGDKGVVVSMQNGYGNIELLTKSFPSERVLYARVITGFVIPEPGYVHITVHADDICIGSFVVPRHLKAQALARALNESGMPARAVDDVEAVLWGKILYNCALNPLGAVLGVHYGALGDSSVTRAAMNTIIDEVFAVIKSNKFPCLWRTAKHFREEFYGKQLPATYAHRPSMLQDLTAGKKTEIDALNGAIVHLAAAKGLVAPANEMIVRMVSFLENRHCRKDKQDAAAVDSQDVCQVPFDRLRESG